MSQYLRDGTTLKARFRHTKIEDEAFEQTLKAFIRAAEHELPDRSAEALSGVFINVMDRFAPSDTGRYKRAWIEAGREAEVTDKPLPQLSESRYADRYEDTLEAQRDGLEAKIKRLQNKMDQWFGSRGLNPRASKGGRQMLSRIRKLKKRLEAAQRELDRARQGGPYILIYGRRERKSAKTGRLVGGRITTIRTNVAGGQGGRIVGGGQTLVRLRNMEPHANIVERRIRAARRSVAAARRIGLKAVRRKAIETLASQSRLEVPIGSVGGRGLPEQLAG